MSPKVLITGATGLIGRHVAIALEIHHELVLTAANKNVTPQGAVLPFDLMRLDLIPEFLQEINPDVVVHTAAITSIDQAALDPEVTMRINCDATAVIARWCHKHNKRLIHFSTDFVFDGTRNDYQETDDALPISTYGKSKLASEIAVRNHHDNFVIIRPILVYGRLANLPRLNFPLLIESKLKEKKTMKITADQWRMPTAAVDVARAVSSLISSPFCGTLHLCGPDYLNMYEFATKTAEVFGLDAKYLEPVSTYRDSSIPTEMRPMVSGFNTSLAKTIVDWDPLSVGDGLKLII